MILARGPRPWAIRLFAVTFAVAGLLAFVDGMRDIPGQASYLQQRAPEFAIDSDTVIVLLSIRLTIALIPIGLVWFGAARFARWLVALFAIAKLVNVPAALELIRRDEAISPWWAASVALSLAGAALLFTPSAGRWFAGKGARAADVFD